jgi:hypothetical protein
MVDRNADVPEDKRITFRIGVNLGDIIVDGDDIYGDGVNIAARLEALAKPGGICISRVVRDQIHDKPPYTFEDLGEQSVKNIARPVRAYAMSASAVAFDAARRSARTTRFTTPKSAAASHRGGRRSCSGHRDRGLVGVASWKCASRPGTGREPAGSTSHS